MRASIKKNTNKAVSSSEESWGSVRSGTMVKFGEDDNFYTAGGINKVFYIKEFDKHEKNSIKIHGLVDMEFVEGDCLKLSYKEYELLTVLSSLNKGKKYKVSDIVWLDGGLPYTDASTGEILYSKLIVSSVSKDGEITQLRMDNVGRYIQTPNENCKLLGGSGEGAEIKVSFKIVDNRSLMEKTITKIEKKLENTIFYLDSDIPDGVVKGKISIEKWEMLLTSNYVGNNRINEKIEFIRDFSPFLKIPFLSKGNSSPEVIYNIAINNIDKALRDLQEQINKLK